MPTPLRLLVAEDSDDDALLLVRTLRQADFTVSFERVDTPAGLEGALARQAWDVVISDYNMPAFNGVEALSIVRARDREVPFIFVSGSIGEEVAVAAMRAGAHDYVMKGNLKRLAPAIQRELREAQVRRERNVAQSRLQMTTEVLQAMFGASPLAIIVSGMDGRVQLWNPAAERLFGWPAHDNPRRRTRQRCGTADARRRRTAGDRCRRPATSPRRHAGRRQRVRRRRPR
jgi:DNA-binding NtrC family response regulator